MNRSAFTLLLLASTALAQERPAENATAAQIADGVEKVQAGKLLDAVEQFQKVLDTAGDELVPVDRHHYWPARWVIHNHLANLPAEGIKLYRQRVDGQAAKRLEEAKKARDDTPLRRMLSDMFAATACEEAIDELARRAFLRGDIDAAENDWSLLLPPIEDDPRRLRYPNAKMDAATLKARLLLIDLFRGERDRVKSELKEFAAKHPNASGLLAGRTGKYADTLMYLVNNPKETTLERMANREGWPTFAGSSDRRGNTRMRLPYFWPDVRTWRAALPLQQHDPHDTRGPDATHRRSLAFHPVVSDGRAYVADGAQFFAIDLMTGRLTKANVPKGGEDTRVPSLQDIKHTLTTADGILYARLGPAALKANDKAASFIIALGDRQGSTEERTALWRLDPPNSPEGFTHFEGTPVVHRDHLFAGIWRQTGGDALAGVACYRIDDLKAAPELVWQKWLGKAGTEPNGETRFRHALLSISGANVVYCTDGGTVIALNAKTGKPAWEYRYPRNERPTLPRYRDLCPPLIDGGRIYAAPADTDRLLCLNAETGQLIWEREGIEVVHLLGVARNRLIATIAGQVKGIRGFHVRNGDDNGTNGWTIHDDGGEATFGRGLVSDDAVVWPTKHGLQFLHPADGSPLRSPIRGSFGNLCFADGVLLVTTATDVWGYVTEAKRLDERRKAIEKEPAKAELHALLTQSLIDAGKYGEAEASATKAGDARERLLWLLAERLIREGEQPEAKRLYESLAKGDSSFAATGAVRLAEMIAEPKTARQAWLAIARRGATLRDELGIPWTCNGFVHRRRSDFALADLNSIRYGGGIVPSPPDALLARDSFTPLEEPTLQILSAGPFGIVAAGEQIWTWPAGQAMPLNDRPHSAAIDRDLIIDATDHRIRCRRKFDGSSIWELDYQANGPIVARLDRPSFPATSGTDGATILADIQLAGGSTEFNYDDRFRIKLDPANLQFNVDPIALKPLSSPQTNRTRKLGLQLIYRDYGVEIDRVSFLTRVWKRDPLFLGRTLDDIAFSGDRFFTAVDGTLSAFDWNTGESQWDIPLPEAPSTTWKITPSPQGLLVHPAEAIMMNREFNAIDAIRRSGGKRGNLLQALGKSYDVWTERELPILVVDPSNGRLRQRLNFPAAGPAAGVAVTANGLVVVTGKGCWTLAGK